MIVTLAEYATLKGVSPQAIRKAIRDGRLRRSIERKGKGYQIDVKLADAEWARNTNMNKSRSAEVINIGKAAAAGMGGEQLAFDTKIGTNYSQYRAYGEGFKAKLLELEYKEKAGQLVRADDVKAEVFKTNRLFRDAVQNIPIRVVAELAAVVGELDHARKHEMMLIMQREIDKALEHLADSNGPR